MIIAMFFLFMFASHYLFNPVRKMLQDRQNKIKGELEQAAQDQERPRRAAGSYEEKLAAVEKKLKRFWQMPVNAAWRMKQELSQRLRKKLQRSWIGPKVEAGA